MSRFLVSGQRPETETERLAPLGVTRPATHRRRLLDVALEGHGRRAGTRAVVGPRLLPDELAAETLSQHDAGRRTGAAVAVGRTLLSNLCQGIVGILVARTPRKECKLPTTLDGQTGSGKGGGHLFYTTILFFYYVVGDVTPVNRRIGRHVLTDGNVSAMTYLTGGQ